MWSIELTRIFNLSLEAYPITTYKKYDRSVSTQIKVKQTIKSMIDHLYMHTSTILKFVIFSSQSYKFYDYNFREFILLFFTVKSWIYGSIWYAEFFPKNFGMTFE